MSLVDLKIDWGGNSYDHYLVEMKGADKADAQRKQELLMQQKAFDQQQKDLADLKTATSKYTTGGGQGFDPSQLASMNTATLGQNAQDFGNASSSVLSALRARNPGGLPGGGDATRGLETLYGAGASSLASGLGNVRLQNSMQALTNKFNALNLQSGNAATLTGTQGVAGAGASSALSSYITAANSGLAQSFVGALGQGIGGGIGAGLTGGVGKALSGFGGGAKGNPGNTGAIG